MLAWIFGDWRESQRPRSLLRWNFDARQLAAGSLTAETFLEDNIYGYDGNCIECKCLRK